MSDYQAPRRDQLFILEHLADLDRVLAQPGHEELSTDVVHAVLDESGKFASEVLAPQNRPGDIAGCRWTRPAMPVVSCPVP